MANVDNIIGLLEQLESRDITVHQYRCVRVRNRNATCRRCADVCTSGCISYDDNRLIIAPEKCIGCGTCATACPTCALEAHRPNDAELLQECLSAMGHAQGEVIIACKQILEAASGLYDPKKVVSVSCLGRVEESLIVNLADAGARRVTLVCGMCNKCDHATGRAMAEEVCGSANTLLDVWNAPMRVRVAERFPSIARKDDQERFDAARRRFFTNVKDEAKTTAEVVAVYAVDSSVGQQPEKEVPEQRFVKVAEDGTLPHFIPNRRERLLEALADFGEPRDELIDTRLWGHVIIDTEKCRSCMMCATFCPTGALVKFDDDGTIGVEHYPIDCVKCHCCEDICPAGAITVDDETFAIDLAEGSFERYEMKPLQEERGGEHSIISAMQKFTKGTQVYER